jgi:hypothetical protein
MNIIAFACDIAKAVESFVQKAKKFFYSVMLFGYRCPQCKGSLVMIAEGLCQCTSCGLEFDPTVTFQRCSVCCGTPVLRVRRYQCKDCGDDITSRFLFDGLVFDTEYFKAKMTESRQRKKALKEHFRQMLAESRSADLPLSVADLNAVPGLIVTLNGLTEELKTDVAVELQDEFDLNRYQEHIQAYIKDFPVSLDEIPPLSKESTRKDRIWRFIALIFLAHYGVVDLLQDGQAIMVIKHEANRKGQDVFGEPEEADGIEGSVGRVEA